MELQELKALWNSKDDEIESKAEVNRQLLKEVSVTKIKSGLAEIKWTAIFELVVGPFFMIFLISFAINNVFDVKFFLPAILLIIVTIAGLIIEGNKIATYLKINSQATVLETQKKLARIDYMERLDVYSLLIFIPMFSGPFLIVMVKAFIGFDLYTFGTQWILTYTAMSFIVAIMIVIALRIFPDKKLKESLRFLRELKAE